MFTPKPYDEDDDEEEYYVTPNFPYAEEDEPQHNKNGFCGNMGHECHENKTLVDELEQSRQDGEVTDQEANNVYRGKTLGGW
jgi:hypothetical protein